LIDKGAERAYLFALFLLHSGVRKLSEAVFRQTQKSGVQKLSEAVFCPNQKSGVQKLSEAIFCPNQKPECEN